MTVLRPSLCSMVSVVKVQWFVNDGDRIDTITAENGKVVVAKVTGSCRDILQGERTALNIISRCSGVATATSEAVVLAKSEGWKGYIAGTRKTTPGESRECARRGYSNGYKFGSLTN